MAAVVRAICMSETMPSCMRAPPEAQKRMSGRPRRTAFSAARTMRSPVPLPRLPPKKAKSITPRTTGCPSISAVPVRMASSRPVFAFVSAALSA